MLIHSTISQFPPHPQQFSLKSSSSLLNSLNFPSGFRNSPLEKPQFHPLIIRNCSSSSVSKVQNDGTMDHEKKPAKMATWKAIYKRISLMGNPENGSTDVLNQWEDEGKKVTKWELCRLVKEFRKYGRYKLALEVYEWMNSRAKNFTLSASDTAIQLDLISKVNGILSAENYFKNLPEELTDKRIYGALLNAYARARMKEKAESLLHQMKEKDYASHALPYNVMMTLYMNLKDHEKVEDFISEMIQNNINLDLYSYNIWISSRGSSRSVEKIEEVFEKLNLDASITPNWTTYSTMATMYLKFGEIEKAESCLRMIESEISGRDRIPYHYLISHYGGIGKITEVQRIWENYKRVFSYIPNMGYHAVISSFLRMDDIEEAEKLYEEWLSVKSTFDPRIGNRLLGWYVRKGDSIKAEAFFEQMLKIGKLNSSTWEIVAEGHIKERRLSDALSCFKKALLNEASSFWKPKMANVTSIYEICEDENDEGSKKALFEVLRQVGVLQDEDYMSKLAFLRKSTDESQLPKVKESEIDDYEGITTSFDFHLSTI